MNYTELIRLVDDSIIAENAKLHDIKEKIAELEKLKESLQVEKYRALTDLSKDQICDCYTVVARAFEISRKEAKAMILLCQHSNWSMFKYITSKFSLSELNRRVTAVGIIYTGIEKLLKTGVKIIENEGENNGV